MDFIEGIGERYLMGKANAAPQMLENLAKKQFSKATNRDAEAPKTSTPLSSEKDEEIAKLRQQLAETKFHNRKATGQDKHATSEKSRAPSSTKSLKSGRSKATGSGAGGGGGSAKAQKEMKGLTPLIITAAPSRGRRLSTSTATAAKAHNPPSESNGGWRLAKPGRKLQGLEALGGKEALHGTKSVHEAASSASSAHALSNRKHPLGQQHSASSIHASSNRRYSKDQSDETRSIARSEARSVSTGVAPQPSSTSIHQALGSKEKGHSVDRKSEMRSETRSAAATVAPRPPPPPSMRQVSRERAPVHEQVVTSTKEYEAEEPGLYVVEVEEEEDRPKWRAKEIMKRVEEEETPKWGAKKIAEHHDGDKNIVEVRHSNGRTVYRVN